MIIELNRIYYINNPEILCGKSYAGHKKGCPNLGKKIGCPPVADHLSAWLEPPFYAIVNEFDLAAHVIRMRSLHLDWSQRQLECCLYWQPKARKQLKILEHEFLHEHPDLSIEETPEAAGVNVTNTLREHGLELEWPPKKIVRQVVIAGSRK
jgi:predicted metal-binding protein